MAVEAAMRDELRDSFTELWDERRAEAVMELMTPDWSGLATKTDLGEIGGRLEQAIAACATKEELNQLRTELRDDRHQLRGEFQAFRSEMREDQHRLRTELEKYGTKADLEATAATLMAHMERIVRESTVSHGRTILASLLGMPVLIVGAIFSSAQIL